MTAERWERVKTLLHRCMQLKPEQRAPFLELACGSDRDLRNEVQSLLLADENVRTSFLQSEAPAPASSEAPPRTDSFPATPGLPTLLGPYEILQPIGKGGMGEVYCARDTRLRRNVAVKILPAYLSRDPSRQKRFAREARATSALNHPNIVSVFDIGCENGISYIVSELVEGESLRSLVARGPAPVAQVVDIGIQLAAGLGAAHAAGIVHRDLKPENIMRTPDGRVKILDFGLAKHMQQRLDAARRTESFVLTAPGMVLGTVGYLSPEQVRSEAVDARSDIFSLGAVLYELASGRPAFPRGKIIEIMNAILNAQPPALEANVPPVLDHLIRCCLEKDAKRRFPDAASVAAALRNVEVSRTRRMPWTNVLGGAAAAILAAVGIWFIPRLLNREQPRSQPQVAGRSVVPQPAVTQPPIETKQTAAAKPGAPGKPKDIAPPEPSATPAIAPLPAATPAKTEPAATAAPRTFVIGTFAGRPWKFTGDGMPVRQVVLGHCDGIKCDREGNIYFSDWGYGVILKIDRHGIAHVIVGQESAGGQPIHPHGFVIDNSAAIYFAEVFMIRKRLPDGRILPVTGNSRRGFTPDGARAEGAAIAEATGIALAADGSVLFSELSNRRVRRVDLQGRLRTVAGNGTIGFSGDGGPATQASLKGPRGLAVDPMGNLYIADTPNHCVRKVSSTGRITTVAGHGVVGNLECPSELALNQQGDLFVSDPCQGRIFVVQHGAISTVGGVGVGHGEPSGDGGPASAASFDEWAITFDPEENLLIAGPVFGHIYRISRDGRFHIIAGSGLWDNPGNATRASQALFDEPFRVAADRAGNVFITDRVANRIYRIDGKGMVSKVAGYGHLYFGYEGENTPAHNYRVYGPQGIRAGPRGNIVFAEHGNNRVREVTADGQLRTLAGNGTKAFGGDGGRAVEAGLNSPTGVCLDNSGNVYIADTNNHRVRKVTADGRISTVAGNGTAGYSGDGGAAERAALNAPTAVETDSNGNLYIADMENHSVRQVSAGVITTLAGDGRPGYFGDGGPAANARMELPSDLALGPNRQLFVLDKFIRRIRRIDLGSGIITTFAGNGESASSGDGGPATQAGLGRPAGIATDAEGNVYVTDMESRQLRIIRPGSQ